MRKIAVILAVSSALAAPVAVQAQEVGSLTTSSKEFLVTGSVPPICSGGSLSSGDSTFALGVLIDTTTGLLRTDLSAPAKVMTGSFCSTRSTINLTATPLAAQNFTATPPTGFSRAVNYTATASGWTAVAASYTTGAATNTAATQTRDSAFSGDITVGLSGFATAGGAALRPVADTSYRGTITVTLTATS